MSKKSFLKKFTGLFSRKKNSSVDEFEFVDENGNVIDPEDYDEFHEDSEEDTGEFTRREMTFTDINRDDLGALGEAPPPLEDLIEEDTDQFDVGQGPSEGDFIEKTHPSIPLDQLEEQLAQINLDDYDEEDDQDFDTAQFVVMSKSKRSRAKNKLLSARSKLGSKFSFFKKGLRGKGAQSKKLSLPANIPSGVSWDDFIALIFAPEKRPRYHQYFIIALCLASSYSIGKVVASFLAAQNQTLLSRRASPQAPLNFQRPVNLREDYNALTNANLFNALLNENPVENEPKKKIPQGPDICESADKRSTLPFTLLNTLVLQDSVKSIASVQMRAAKEPLIVREGEKIERLAEVGRIDSLRVVFKNLQSGECEYIASEEEKPNARSNKISVLGANEGKRLMQESKDSGIHNEGNKFQIKKTLRDEMLGNISEVLTQARAVQIKNPDGSFAFKMTEIVPGSIYSKLNLQNEDIITQINGKKITNLNEIMSLFGRIKEVDQLSLTISRGGMEQELDYNFE